MRDIQVPVYRITRSKRPNKSGPMVSIRLPEPYKSRYDSIQFQSKQKNAEQQFSDFVRDLVIEAIEKADVPTDADDIEE